MLTARVGSFYLGLPARSDVEFSIQRISRFNGLTARGLRVVLTVAVVTAVLITDVTVTVALTPTHSHTVVQ